MSENEPGTDQPQAVFIGTVRASPDAERWVVEVPHEVDVGPGETYTVALYQPEEIVDPDDSAALAEQKPSAPPVREGEFLDLEIEAIGDEGDGIAKIRGGYTVFVPDGKPGDTVTVEIETAKPRFAFATIRATLSSE